MSRQIQSTKADKDLEIIREKLAELVRLTVYDSIEDEANTLSTLVSQPIEEILEYIALQQSPRAILQFEQSLHALRVKFERLAAVHRQMPIPGMES